MPPAGFGELKKKALDFIASRKGTTNDELAIAISRTPVIAGVMACDYRKQGFISSRKAANVKGARVKHYIVPGTWPPGIKSASEPNVIVEPTPTPEPVDLPRIPTPAEVPRTSFAEQLQSTVQVLANTIAGEIVNQLQPLIVAQLNTMISGVVPSEALKTMSIDTVKPMPKAPMLTPDKVSLKRVCILGLWPAQAGHIQDEFHECFDLRYINVDDSIQQLKASTAHADAVFVMVGKISHKHTDALKADGTKFEVIRGGLTNLREQLTALYVEITK